MLGVGRRPTQEREDRRETIALPGRGGHDALPAAAAAPAWVGRQSPLAARHVLLHCEGALPQLGLVLEVCVLQGRGSASQAVPGQPGEWCGSGRQQQRIGRRWAPKRSRIALPPAAGGRIGGRACARRQRRPAAFWRPRGAVVAQPMAGPLSPSPSARFQRPRLLVEVVLHLPLLASQRQRNRVARRAVRHGCLRRVAAAAGEGGDPPTLTAGLIDRSPPHNI